VVAKSCRFVVNVHAVVLWGEDRDDLEENL